MAAARGAAFAAAVRMVDRVHGDAADVRAATEPTLAAGLADDDILVVGVADRADRGQALARHEAQLARAQLDLGVARVLADELGVVAGRTGELAAAGLLELDVVDDRAHRHVAERHGVAGLDV